MELCDFYALLPDVLPQTDKGIFLTAGGDTPNPMTIGWAQFGVIWGRPTALVLVRRSRYTYWLMQNTDVFALSVPAPGTMKKELAYCGSHSGREGDKYAAAGLSRARARFGGADGVDGCALRLECKIVQRTDMPLDRLDDALRTRFYVPGPALPDGDPHVLFFGEALGACRG